MTSLRRYLIAGLLAVAGLGLAAGSAVADTTPPRAQLSQFTCTHALDPAQRAVSVQAIMRPLAGTRRLAIKFELFERVAGAPTKTVVRAGDLGVWVTPDDPTLGQLPGDLWRLNKTVLNLDAPATYQFQVTFRWTGVHGHVLGTAVRLTKSCRQRELRPDLLVSSIDVSAIAGHPNEDLYEAHIANQGLTGAGPFEVLFVPGDGSAATTKTVGYLGAGARQTLSFVGPVCSASSPPSVTVDAADQVDDDNRSNNEMTAVCPALSGG